MSVFFLITDVILISFPLVFLDRMFWYAFLWFDCVARLDIPLFSYNTCTDLFMANMSDYPANVEYTYVDTVVSTCARHVFLNRAFFCTVRFEPMHVRRQIYVQGLKYVFWIIVIVFLWAAIVKYRHAVCAGSLLYPFLDVSSALLAMMTLTVGFWQWHISLLFKTFIGRFRPS